MATTGKARTVWVVTEETNGDSHGFPDLLVVGVHRTEAGAEREQARRVQAAQADGKRVHGHIPEGDREPDYWNIDIDVTAWPVGD